MTLIALYANQDFAVVAADRRITYPDRSIYENDRTKLLAWGSGLVFGFTGQALLVRGREQVPTLEWLAHEISSRETAGSVDFNAIAEKLDRQRFLASRRLAIGAVGFVSGNPIWLLISNMHNQEGVTETPARRFNLVHGSFNKEFFKTLGGNLSQTARDLLESRMPSVRDQPEAVRELLAGAIERSSNALVGDQALTVSFYRDPLRQQGFICDLVTPGMNRPGVLTDFAMPLFVNAGAVTTMPPQQLRRAGRYT